MTVQILNTVTLLVQEVVAFPFPNRETKTGAAVPPKSRLPVKALKHLRKLSCKITDWQAHRGSRWGDNLCETAATDVKRNLRTANKLGRCSRKKTGAHIDAFLFVQEAPGFEDVLRTCCIYEVDVEDSFAPKMVLEDTSWLLPL